MLNGKLDLVQAEAIGDLIASRTTVQARVALSNLDGEVSRIGTSVRSSLLHVISRLEAALDFADEGYEFIERNEVERTLRNAREESLRMLATYERGRAVTHGLSAVILGKPNAGKSTLLNFLCGTERAIVTPIPGTTRDLVRETIEIGGIPVTVTDTAGLRVSEDVVEEIGVRRARDAAAAADLVIYLIDASAVPDPDEMKELASLAPSMLIYTKCDLAQPPPGALGISITERRGTEALLTSLDARVRSTFVPEEGSPTLVNERQRAAVAETVDAIDGALTALAAGSTEEIVLVELYRASNAIGLLTGAVTRDEILHEIFAKFCIGK